MNNDNIKLVPITEDDTQMVLSWRNSDAVKRFFIYREDITEKDHRKWLSEKVATGKVAQFIIYADDRPIGSVYLQNIDHITSDAEFGIFIGDSSALGKGYGTQAGKLILDYAFNVLKLKKVNLRVLENNKRAIKSYEHLGFVIEKVLENEVIIDNQPQKVIWMAIKSENFTETVSFVIPCYRSALTLPSVVEEIQQTMANLSNKYSYDIILVNDCSPDNTFEVIKELSEKYSNIRGVNLARNFGQHSALMAGYHFAKGDYVVSLDDDGQTPANEVGKLLDKIHEGFDVVYAEYEQKQHSFFRNLGSRLNAKMTESLLNKPKELFVSSYFVTRKYVIDEITKYDNSFPYVIGLILRTAKLITNVKVTHRERTSGKSGYSISKLFSLWINGFTSFSVKPLHIAIYIGIISAVLGMLYMIYVVVMYFAVQSAPTGWSTLISIILLLGGVILLVLGLIGEYVGRIYICINKSPQYVIRETTNMRGVKKNEKD